MQPGNVRLLLALASRDDERRGRIGLVDDDDPNRHLSPQRIVLDRDGLAIGCLHLSLSRHQPDCTAAAEDVNARVALATSEGGGDTLKSFEAADLRDPSRDEAVPRAVNLGTGG